ncbi:MAG: hypothetical protein WAU91_11535 [Desulfatitalea sp.]
MKLLRFILLILLLPVACAHLPEIRKADDGAERQASECTGIFPQGEWQFAHTIQIFPPGGSKQTLLGIIQMSSRNRTFHCVMMTIEGLVLFEAHYDGAITIQRAVPPLDKPGLAEGMVRDILLLFFPPEQHCTATGLSQAQEWVCRYPSVDQGFQDIVLRPDHTWQIRRYSQSQRLLRTIAPLAKEDINPNRLATRVELKAHGLAGYRLIMSLMEAIPLDGNR